MTINRDEWLKALASVDPPTDDSAMTALELGVLLGLGRTAAKERLLKLVKAGTAVVTAKRIKDSAGRQQIVTAYKLLDPKAAKPRRRRAS